MVEETGNLTLGFFRSDGAVLKAEKQMLQHEVPNLTDLVGFFKNTTARPVNELLNRLEPDLDFCTACWKV